MMAIFGVPTSHGCFKLMATLSILLTRSYYVSRSFLVLGIKTTELAQSRLSDQEALKVTLI